VSVSWVRFWRISWNQKTVIHKDAPIFQKSVSQLKIPGAIWSDMKQLPLWGPANIRRYRTKFSPLDDLARRICAPTDYCIRNNRPLDTILSQINCNNFGIHLPLRQIVLLTFHLHVALSSGIFSTRFPSRILHEFFISSCMQHSQPIPASLIPLP
jgi:hypothetical protein